VTPSGIDQLWSTIEAHERFLDESDARRAAERRRLSREIVDRAASRLSADLGHRLENDPALRRLLDEVLDRKIDPRTATERLLAGRARRRGAA
jgi:LAO/AO transport system kinase